MVRVATILIADQDQERRELLANRLSAEGYHLLEAADGQDALDIAINHHVDLMLVHPALPRRDGISVCQALKVNAQTAFIPILLLADKKSIKARVQAFEVGADGIVALPGDLKVLLPRIRALSNAKRLTDELEHAESIATSFALGIDANDSYTAGHSERVAEGALKLAARLPSASVEIALGLGKRIGLVDSQLKTLYRAALVHDVGKLGIPTEVIRKQGKLTPTERSLIELHPVIGERICRPLKSFAVALPIIRHHHEKLDGSGYPDGLRGTQIPLLTRIVSIADVYDALTSTRSYRKSFNHSIAISLLREEAHKGWWDAELVEEFAIVAESIT